MSDLLLHLNRQWSAFDGVRLSDPAAFPPLQRPTLVITDFENAVSGTAAFEGRPDHAAHVIERRLRADGLIDGESKVLVHDHRRVGNGYQALYTAVPIEQWQRMLIWAEQQPDHCLLLPHVALLRRTLKVGEGIVLRAGAALTFVAVLRDRLVHAAALAFSEEADDLEMAATSLAERVAAQLAHSQEELAVTWCAVLDSFEEQRLRTAFATGSGVPVKPAPHAPVIAADGTHARSALPGLAARASVRIAVNTAGSRSAWLAERALPWAAAAAFALALVLAGLGGYWSVAAAAARNDAETLHTQAATLAQSLQAATHDEPPAAFVPTREFIEHANEVLGQTDPQAGLAVLREAAAGEVRILRVRLDQVAGSSALRVEGLVEDAGGSSLARFVEHLRRTGFEPVAVDPSGSTVHPTGFFTYQLVPVRSLSVAANAGEKTP